MWYVFSQQQHEIQQDQSASVYLTIDDASIAAIDSANTITDPQWFKRVYDDGFRLYVFHTTEWGTCNPWSRAQIQAKLALDAGLMIAAYTRDPRCFEQGIKALGDYQGQLQFFALDIETDPGIPVTRAMVDGVRALGVLPVIYSGSGMWPSIMDDSSAFSDVPLWDTRTSTFKIEDWRVDVRKPDPVVYGGWNTTENPRIGVQEQFEYTLHGVNVDLNSFRRSFFE